MKRLSALIDACYAAAMEPGRWPTIVLRASTPNYDTAEQQAYMQHFHALDLWANGWRAIGCDGIYTGAQLVDPAAFRDSEFHWDFADRRDRGRCGMPDRLR